MYRRAFDLKSLTKGVLGPDEIRIMRVSYENAIRCASPIISAEPPAAQAQRNMIAKRIVGLVVEGERDVEILSRKGAAELG
jgi:hypothetical protein